MNDDKKIKTSSQKRLWGHQERKNNLKDYSVNKIRKSNLISSETSCFKIINGVLK